MRMTKKQARECLICVYQKIVEDGLILYSLEEVRQALDIAIDNLKEDKDSKKVEKYEKAIEDIKAEIADLDDAEYEFEGYYKAVNDALQIIDKYIGVNNNAT